MGMNAPVGPITARAYTVPTDAPEADGTFAWQETTLVIVTIEAGGRSGLGYTYSAGVITGLVTGALAEALHGQDVFDIPRCHRLMANAVRNLGRSGLAATAISAVDAALWDLKAKLLDRPLVNLLGGARDEVPIYGSGGFTSYDDAQLTRQLAGWVERDGCRAVKMKIGTHPEDDTRRVRVAKSAIGDATLFVDANGALSAKEALRFADIFATEAGSRSRSRLMIWTGWRKCGQVRPPAWILPLANMPSTPTTCATCWRAGPWTCSKRMRPAAWASPASCKPGCCATPTTSICPVIARRRCICTAPARCPGYVTSNGFMTMCASSRCCSMVPLRRRTARSDPTSAAPG